MKKSNNKAPSSFYRKLEEHGFYDFGQNKQLLGHIEDDEYYRNAGHLPNYIRSAWEKHFEILDVIEGMGPQDLVVMRRR